MWAENESANSIELNVYVCLCIFGFISSLNLVFDVNFLFLVKYAKMDWIHWIYWHWNHWMENIEQLYCGSVYAVHLKHFLLYFSALADEIISNGETLINLNWGWMTLV